MVPNFHNRFKYFTVDEAHLVIEWQPFRSAFSEIKRLRSRFVQKVAWLAQSATVEPKEEFPALIHELGFRLATTTVLRLPVDRSAIAYAPRFLAHSVSDSEFLDLAWIVPHRTIQPVDIPITVIFAERIEQVTRIAAFLTGLLPRDVGEGSRAAVVQPITGIMSNEHNRRVVQSVRDGGQTRIIVCTDTGALGIDISQVQQVVVLVETGTTYRMLCQKIGRIRNTGLAVLYFHKWMDSSSRSASYASLRGSVEKVMVDFANATLEKCPRVVNVEHWGDSPTILDADMPCCNIHNPELDTNHLEMVKAHVARLKAKKSRQSTSLRSDRTYPPPDEDVMQPLARKMIYEWRRANLSRSVGYKSLSPLSSILPEHLVLLLAKKLHLCTNIERFREVMASWSRLDEWGKSLYGLVEKIWDTFELDNVAEEIGEAQARCKGKRKSRRSKESTDEGLIHVTEQRSAKSKHKRPTTKIASKKAGSSQRS